MQKKGDAMVSIDDLNQAVDEKRRGCSDATMARLLKTEPYLATYLESLAAHFASRPDLDGKRAALGKLLVIVRATEIGQYHLWRSSIDPSSPLGRIIAPADDAADGQKK